MPIPTLEQSNIVNEYIGGKSVLALAHQYQANTRVINKILKDNNIAKISQAKRLNSLLKEDYFEVIDSNEKAYWIGWLLTDGGITKDNSVEIALSSRDKYILELFEKDIGVKKHVTPYCQKYHRFMLGSVKMCNDLKQFGIIPNKTLNLKFPQNIPKQFEVSLLRGMFEGDGGLSIGITTRFYKHRNKSYTKPYQELNFTGTYDMCKGFQDAILKYINIPEKSITRNHSIYRVRWSNKEEIVKILDLLYKNCNNHYLKRKYDLYQELKGEKVS